jgi:hypothetical protein
MARVMLSPCAGDVLRQNPRCGKFPCAGAALDPPLWKFPNKFLSLSLAALDSQHRGDPGVCRVFIFQGHRAKPLTGLTRRAPKGRPTRDPPPPEAARVRPLGRRATRPNGEWGYSRELSKKRRSSATRATQDTLFCVSRSPRLVPL